MPWRRSDDSYSCSDDSFEDAAMDALLPLGIAGDKDAPPAAGRDAHKDATDSGAANAAKAEGSLSDEQPAEEEDASVVQDLENYARLCDTEREADRERRAALIGVADSNGPWWSIWERRREDAVGSPLHSCPPRRALAC